MKRNALIIGINYYNYHTTLSGCVNDAEKMNGLLHKNEDKSLNFNTELIAVKNSVDSRSHSQEILYAKCEQLFSQNCEVALFYFSGHGAPTASGAQLCFSGYQAMNRVGIDFEELMEMANKSPALNKVIILDCCFSGSLSTVPYLVEKVAIRNGITVLAASKANQSALDKNGQGVFTQLLIDSLKGEAADILGNISPASVYAHIDKSLHWTEQRPLYIANNSHFISLRKTKSTISIHDLQAILELFEFSNEKCLDPSYEPNPPKINPEYPPLKKHTDQFAILQRLNRVGLVAPCSKEHMYYEAMEFGKCKLTLKGIYYKKLLEAGML